MKADEYRQLLQQASQSTRRLNGETVAAGTPAAVAQSGAVPALAGGQAHERRGTGRVHVCYTVFRCRPCDPDNHVTKWLTDSLRRAGIIADDTDEHIELQVKQVKVKTKAQQGTMIEVTPL